MELSHCSTFVESESRENWFDFNRTLKGVLCGSVISKLGKHAYTESNLAQQEQLQLETCVQRHLKDQSQVWPHQSLEGFAELSVYTWSQNSYLVSSQRSIGHTLQNLHKSKPTHINRLKILCFSKPDQECRHSQRRDATTAE